MTIANPFRLFCAAALSLVLMGGGIPALATESTTATPPASPSPAEVPPASAEAEPAAPLPIPATEPSAPVVGTDTVDPAAVPSAPPSEPQTVPSPAAEKSDEVPSAEPAPSELTSEVPPADWDPTLEPGFDPMPAERLPRPEGPLPTVKTPNANGLSAAAYGPRTGNFKVTLVTVQLAGKSAADVAAIDLGRARASIAASSSYWKKMSDNRLSMSISREVQGFKSSARITDSYDQIMATVTREMGWQFRPYESLVIFVPHANLNSYGTWGVLGGGFTDGATTGRIIMPYTSALTNTVVAHEFGHVLGLHHSNSLYCSNGRSDVPRSGGRWSDSACFTNEYGDTMDLMGYAQAAMPTINSFFWEYGGFGRGNEILNAGTAQGAKNYTLKAWSGTETNRAVKFTDPVSKEVYYLELRLPVGYDAALAHGGNRGVKIIKKDLLGWDGNASIVLTPNSRWLNGYYNQNHAWQAGSTFTTHAGTKVKINSVGTTSASITITAPTPPVAANRDVLRFSTADFDGDKSADLITRRSDGTLWFSAGTGTRFSDPRQIGSGWHVFDLVFALNDFNQDGRNDLAARTPSGDLWLYPGDGKSGFGTATRIGTGWQGFDTVFGAGDATSDGIVDLGARDKAGNLYIYPGAGQLKFKSPMVAGSGWNGLDSIDGRADYTGDNRPDIISRDWEGGLRLHVGTGRGTYAKSVLIGSGWGGFTNVFAGQDPNSDGHTDLIARDTSGNLHTYLRDGKGGYLGKHQVGHGWDFKSVLEGTDFDRDGFSDLLAISDSGQLGLYSGDGQAGFKGSRVIGSGWQNLRNVLNGHDFDGNSKPDLLARTTAGELLLYTTDGNGRFTGSRQIGHGWQNFTSILGVGDFDGDGRSDLVGRLGNGDLLLYSGNGTGGFLGSGLKIGHGWQNFTALISSSDFNGDGTPDLLARTSSGTLILYPGNGAGGFRASGSLGAGWSQYPSLMSVDGFLSNGKPSVLATQDDGRLFAYAGNGFGGLSAMILNSGSM